MFEKDDNEFDVQKTILKKKQRKNSSFYVEYDKLTYQVLGIYPEKIAVSNIRNTLLEVPESSLIREIFNNKISLHRLKIKHDYQTGTKVLYKNYELKKWEFDYIRTNKNEENFIHLHCDVISKKVTANFVEQNFMNHFTTETVNEMNLSQLPSNLNVYAIDKHEPSKLLGTINLNFKQLFLEKQQRFNCVWLPDSLTELENVDFLYYNHDLKIAVNSNEEYTPKINIALKPAILYKQQGNILEIQSVMNDTKNFHLNDTIDFYLYNANDPSQILDVVSLNTQQLDNFNLVEVKLKTKKPIKMISNYHYLHIEDANVSTYYQF